MKPCAVWTFRSSIPRSCCRREGGREAVRESRVDSRTRCAKRFGVRQLAAAFELGARSSRACPGLSQGTNEMKYVVIIEESANSFGAYMPGLPGCAVLLGKRVRKPCNSSARLLSSMSRACGNKAIPCRRRPRPPKLIIEGEDHERFRNAANHVLGANRWAVDGRDRNSILHPTGIPFQLWAVTRISCPIEGTTCK